MSGTKTSHQSKRYKEHRKLHRIRKHERMIKRAVNRKKTSVGEEK